MGTQVILSLSAIFWLHSEPKSIHVWFAAVKAFYIDMGGVEGDKLLLNCQSEPFLVQPLGCLQDSGLGTAASSRQAAINSSNCWLVSAMVVCCFKISVHFRV